MEEDIDQEDPYDVDMFPNVNRNGNGVGALMKAVNTIATNPVLQTDETEDDEEDLFLNNMIDSNVLRGVKVQRPNPGSDIEDDEEYRSYRNKRKKMNRKKRVIKKGGLTNVTYKNISKKRRRYISDIYTTLLDSPWHWCIFIFVVGFYGSWFIFGGIYFMICYLHGDLEVHNEIDPLTNKTTVWEPCIANVDSFAASFLFSLETQHTIGYGGRMITTKCPDAMLVMSVQSVLGCLIQAFIVGLVFSKLSRPRYRCKTIIFSNQAVICQRNRKLCLVIRIGDLRDDNFILGTQLSAKLLRRRTTLEGEMYQEMHYVNVNPDTSNESCIFFVWPLDIVHVIDETSPFYDMSADDLAKERFELLLIMEGTNETSNMTFQARTSYLPSEILWGQRFEPMLLYRKDNNKFQINFSAFHSTYEVDTPLCSGRDLDQFYKTYGRKIPSKVSSLPINLKANMLNPSPCGVSKRKLSELAMQEELTSISRANSNSSNKTARQQAIEKKKQKMSTTLLPPGLPSGLPSGIPSNTSHSGGTDTTATATFTLGKQDDESNTSDECPEIDNI